MKKIILSILIICIGLPLIGQTFGNAIDLDGIDDYALVPHHESLNPGNGSWTIALWVKAPDVIQRGPLVGKRLRMEGYNQYTLGIGHTDPHNPSPGRRLYYNYIDSAGVSERSGHLQDEFVDGKWHHIVVVADKTADNVLMYIDGTPETFIMDYDFGTWPEVGRLDSVLIARNSSGSHHLEGVMDELSLWCKALSQQQIDGMRNDTLGPAYYTKTDSGLVAYYRFDEFEDLGINDGGADDFRDLSSYENHADSEGSPTLIPSGILTAVNETIVFAEFSIFPNPARDKFGVRSLVPNTFGVGVEAYTIELYDLNGKKLLEKQIPKGAEEVTMDVSGLQSGVYCCRLIMENKSVTKKLIIQK